MQATSGLFCASRVWFADCILTLNNSIERQSRCVPGWILADLVWVVQRNILLSPLLESDVYRRDLTSKEDLRI